MKTESRGYAMMPDGDHGAAITPVGVDASLFGDEYTDSTQSALTVRAPRAAPLLSKVVPLLIAATALTSPIAYVDDRRDLRLSGASTVMWVARPRHGRSISLATARLMALEVLSETERRLREERVAEARFLLEPWGEELGFAQ